KRNSLIFMNCKWSLSEKVLVDQRTEMYGSLESPNFPDPYPTDTRRNWTISVPDGFRITLFFSHFDLEPSYLCEYDFVKVEADGEALALFCGKEETDTEAVPAQRVITSPRNTLSVQFVSDFSNEERFSGFVAHYSAVDIDECSEPRDEDPLCDHFCHNFIGGYYCSCRYGYQLHTDNHTCRAVDCSGVVFRERSGVLNSVNFPAPYPKSSDCWYRIELEAGFRIQMNFDPRFDVESHPDISCPYDHLKVQTGSREFGPFCGDRSPGIIRTDSNIVSIQFHSDDSGENLGWRLSYSATEIAGSQCPVPEAPPNAVMVPIQSEYTFRDHVVFSCQPGFILVQDGGTSDRLQLECQADGSWSGRPPHCDMLDCGIPKKVDGAVVMFGRHDNSTLFGATLRYVCVEDGVQLSNSKMVMMCGPAGEWVDADGGTQLPVCLPACGLPSRPLPHQVKRIVGGRSSEPGFFPWQVLLSVEDLSRVPEDRWFGSGALLSQSWILTAAHVLRSQRRDATVVPVVPHHVKVFLGLHSLRDKQTSTGRSVDQIVLHPDFQPDNYNNDIALLRLSEAAEFNRLVRPVCLPPAHQQDRPSSLLPNSLGLVAGWGISNASSNPSPLTSDLLQYVKLPVVPQDECQASYASRSVRYNITDNMFCAGFFQGGRDTCLGDSGGAFVMQAGRRWAVFGLVSWAGPEDCGSQRVYGVYTRVEKYLDWIQSHVQAAPWW
uniref:MBL associated serine protease 1 n=1 Tax=Poecilia formosa TaxID=48698 RepID=A0A096M5R1_POEFO